MQRAFACLALLLLAGQAPALAQDAGRRRAEALFERLKSPQLRGADELQAMSTMSSLGEPGLRVLARRWEELKGDRLMWALTEVARRKPALIVPAVRKAARSGELDHRRAASATFYALAHSHPGVVQELAPGLARDPDVQVAVNAVRCLGETGDQASWRFLLDFVAWELTSELRRDAVLKQAFKGLELVLQANPTHPLINELFVTAAAIKDRDPQANYGRVLSVLGSCDAALPYLWAILRESYPLADTGGEAEDDVVPTLTPEEMNAQLALREVLGEDGRGGIADELRPWPADIRLIAVRNVAHTRNGDALPYLMRALSDDDVEVRRQTINVIGWVAPKQKGEAQRELIEYVIPLLVDRDHDLRRLAQRWLQRTTGAKQVPRSLPAWKEWLEQDRFQAELTKALDEEAQAQGFTNLAALLKAQGLRDRADFLALLGYESEQEFMADRRAEEDDDADE